MRLRKAIMVVLALLVMLLGVQSLVAMEKDQPTKINPPAQTEDNPAYDPGDGDPWQDEDGGDPFTVSGRDPSGISGIVFVNPGIGSWNSNAFLVIVKVKLGLDNNIGKKKVTNRKTK